MKKILMLSLSVFIQLSVAMRPDYTGQLFDATRAGNLELAKQALDNGANVNENYSDWTPLLQASYSGNVELVNLFIAHGANIHFQDSEGWQALMMASNEGNVEVVKVLLASGTHVDAINDKNATALVEASFSGLTNVVKLLLAAGAEVNCQTDFGATALMGASENGETEVVKLLLDAGADPNTKSENYETVFVNAHKRYYFGNKEVVLLLQSVEAFLDHPIEQTDAHPENINDYLGWSIAYKKDKAYSHLIAQNPDLLKQTKNVIRYFLIAARAGNLYVLNSLSALLKARKPEGYKFVFLKALNLIMKLHPELSYLVHQVLAEDIALSKTASENKKK